MVQIQDYVSKAHHVQCLYDEIRHGFRHPAVLKSFEERYAELVEVAREHAPIGHLRPASRNLWVVHPLTHEVNGWSRPRKIRRLLDALEHAEDGTRKILVDSAIEYILATHALVEIGMFDHVLFTPYLIGCPLNQAEIGKFGDASENDISGCYKGKMCLDEFVLTLRENLPEKNIKIVRKWSYDPRLLMALQIAYGIAYSKLPGNLRRRIPEPHIDDFFIPEGTFG